MMTVGQYDQVDFDFLVYFFNTHLASENIAFDNVEQALPRVHFNTFKTEFVGGYL